MGAPKTPNETAHLTPRLQKTNRLRYLALVPSKHLGGGARHRGSFIRVSSAYLYQTFVCWLHGVLSTLQFIGLLTILPRHPDCDLFNSCRSHRLCQSRWALSFDSDVRSSPLLYRFSCRGITAISRLSPEERKRTPREDDIAQPYLRGPQRYHQNAALYLQNLFWRYERLNPFN
jgi:hypothetical protein